MRRRSKKGSLLSRFPLLLFDVDVARGVGDLDGAAPCAGAGGVGGERLLTGDGDPGFRDALNDSSHWEKETPHVAGLDEIGLRSVRLGAARPGHDDQIGQQRHE